MDYDLPSPSLDAVIYEQPLGSVQVLCQRVLGGWGVSAKLLTLLMLGRGLGWGGGALIDTADTGQWSPG